MPVPRRRMAVWIAAGSAIALLCACTGPGAAFDQAAQRAAPPGAELNAAEPNPAEPNAAGPDAAGLNAAGLNAADPAGVPSTVGEPDPLGAGQPAVSTAAQAAAAAPGAEADPSAGFTIAFAGDVNFSERTADRLAADPSTAFGSAAPGLAAADLTVVNLETAITTGGEPEPKSYTFRAPPSAFTALRSAGIDVASMANNHGADYGPVGLQDTLAAIERSRFPVIGIGADRSAALTPFRTLIGGVRVAIFAASAVHDHTLATWTATAAGPGIASAFDPGLAEAVRDEAAGGAAVVVFLHWGTEYDSCPDGDQEQLAVEFADAGAAAVIGTHAHVLQGAGWRSDGVYVAYGLSNYLWWRSFGNEQDDNGVLTLTFEGAAVTAANFAPSHLDEGGVPVPATGATADRINADWERVRECTDLTDTPPD